MSEITEFMNDVKEYAVYHNIDFIMMTNEGKVSNGLVRNINTIKAEEPKTPPKKHKPTCRDIARIYSYLCDQKMEVYLLKGSPLDTYTEPAVYVKTDTEDGYNKYYISIMYEDVWYDILDVYWYYVGYRPMIEGHEYGVAIFQIMNNQLIELMKANNIFTEEIVGKEAVCQIHDYVDIISELKTLPWNLKHGASLKTELCKTIWCKIIDCIIEAIKYSVNEFYNSELFK